MKTNIITSVLCAILSLMAISCSKDNSAQAPVITLSEVGHENSKMAMPGGDLHLEADVVAQNLIKRIDVELHMENGTYEIEEAYLDSKYVGVRNTTFHEHLEIPADAPLGNYHMHFTVTDMKGNTAMSEAHVQIVEHIDDHEE